MVKILEFQLQHQSFQWIFRVDFYRVDWLDLLAVQGTLKSLLQHHSSKASILQYSAFSIVQLSHPYMTTGNTVALTIQTFVGKVMSLLFNMLSRFVIDFLPRNKCLLWLQSLFTVILEPKKIKSVTVSIYSPSICHEVLGSHAMIFIFWMLSLSQLLHSSFTFIKSLFGSSLLFAIRVVSSAYLRLLLFFPAVFIFFQLLIHPAQNFTCYTLYGCESWTMKKPECWRIDAFELWWWRRLLRVPWTAGRSNNSILKEISPGCSLEGLMLKLKLQYFGHLMQRPDSFEKTLMLERLRVGGEGDNRGWDRRMASLTRWTCVWVDSGCWWWTGRPGVLRFMGLQGVGHNWVTELNSVYKLNKQGDTRQLKVFLSKNLNQSVVACPILTVASWPAFKFSGG